MKKHIIIFILTTLAILYLYSTSLATQEEKLSLYANKKLEESTIDKILSNAYGKDNYNGFSIEKDKIKISLKSTDDFYVYLRAEHDAAVLFSLVDKLQFVDYIGETDNYNFEKNQFKFSNLTEITNHYSKLQNQKKYLGNINGYLIFDQTDICNFTPQLVYENDTNYYYSECSKTELIEVIKNGEVYGLIEALNDGFFTIDDLNKTQLKILIEEKKWLF